jgi:hypothetical protein
LFHNRPVQNPTQSNYLFCTRDQIKWAYSQMYSAHQTADTVIKWLTYLLRWTSMKG